MKQLLSRILSFTCFAAVVISCLWFAAFSFPQVETHLVAKRSDEGGLRLRTEEFESLYKSPKDSLDFLFLGSSTCYCGIDPYALEANGYKAFSLCSSAQGIENSADILDYALERCTPRFIVLDAYPEFWDGPLSSVECESDWIINGPRLPLRRIEPYNAFLKLYHLVADYLGVDHKPWSMKSTDKYSGLGFVERNKPPIDSVDCPDESSKTMSSEYLQLLADISSKAQTIVVIPPVLCGQELDALIAIDGNDWPGSKDLNNYYDDHHLMAEGAKDYSGWLAEKLIRLSQDPSE